MSVWTVPGQRTPTRPSGLFQPPTLQPSLRLLQTIHPCFYGRHHFLSALCFVKPLSCAICYWDILHLPDDCAPRRNAFIDSLSHSLRLSVSMVGTSPRKSNIDRPHLNGNLAVESDQLSVGTELIAPRIWLIMSSVPVIAWPSAAVNCDDGICYWGLNHCSSPPSGCLQVLYTASPADSSRTNPGSSS